LLTGAVVKSANDAAAALACHISGSQANFAALMNARAQEYELRDGRRLYVLGEGRLVNLAAAEGHPASVMDMSFANQALCAEYVAKAESLPLGVMRVPEEIDYQVASLKLQAMGLEIDTLTPEQRAYLESWERGT
jgi:adenosylhomocysteinase